MIHGVFYKTTPSMNYRETIEDLHADLVLYPLQENITSTSFPHCWLAQTVEKTDLNPKLISIGSPPRVVISAWARLDNRDGLSDMLGISRQELNLMHDSALILHAWLKFGDDCTLHLFGDFCFAIYDIQKNRLFCARDQMGIKPFYYYNDQHVFVFSSSMTLFHRLPNIEIKPRMEWASRFLLNHSLAMDFEKTAYHTILKLSPAHQCCVTPDTMTKKRYFSFHTNKIHLKTSDDYVDFYREQLDMAIKIRAQVDHPLGSELSGGIDSSTVTAYAIRHYQRPLNDFHTFGFAYFEHEPKHILRMSQHFRIPMTYICCNISLFDADPRRPFTALGAPSLHGNAVSHEIFYDMASRFGVRTLLSGFGGDEFVTSIHGYLYLHECLKNRQYIQLYQNLPGNSVTRALRFLKYSWHHLKNQGVQNTHMADAYRKRWPEHVIADNLVQAYALKEAHDAQGAFDYGYHDLDRFTLENRLAPFVSTRTEECTLMAATYGIDYRWPLLDVRLIQSFLSIPNREKYHRGTGRYLHKRAIADIVPKNIVDQNSKYMGKRIAQSIPQQITLNQDLHPALSMLLNLPKLLAQEKRLLDRMKKDPFALHDVHLMPVRKNMHRVNALDRWLKYYFAEGCDWTEIL